MSGPKSDIIILKGVTVADVARALAKSGLGISNGAFKTLFVISPTPSRFPTEPNVIDLTVPAFHRRQAGPERDIKGIDFDVVHNGRDFDVINGPDSA